MALIDTDTLPSGEEKVRSVRAMFDSIAPRYDLVNRLMTFGLDVRWRKRAVRELGLEERSHVADLACGTGDFCRELSKGGIAVVGADMSAGMLRASRTTAPLVEADALNLPFADATLDGATCGFALRNFVSLDTFIDELARIIRPGGRIALLEVDEPSSRLLRWGHQIYFGKVVPLVGGLFSDRSAYQYLPKSVEYLPDESNLLKMVSDGGFEEVTKHRMTLGVAQLIVATRAN